MCVLCFQMEAQSIDKRYRSYIGNGGTAYFFLPKKLKETEGVKNFVYDITHLSITDTVTLNFTIVVEEPVMVDSLVLVNSDKITTVSSVSLLYRDVLDEGYEIRTTSGLALQKMQSVYSDASPLEFKMYLSNGKVVKAAYKKSQWKKERETVSRILNSIKPLR